MAHAIVVACRWRCAESLGAVEKRLQRPQEQQFGAAALTCHAEIEPRRLLGGRHRVGEKAVSSVDPRRWEYRGAFAIKEAADLALRATDRRRRGNYLRANALFTIAARCEQIDGCLIEAGDCPEWP